MRFRAASFLGSFALLSACVAQQQAPAPAPRQAAQPAAPVRALPAVPVGEDWRDVALSPGGWSYRSDGAAGSIAQFGPAGGAASFAVRCDARARRILLSRGASAAPTASLGFITSFGDFSLPALAAAGQPPAAAASLPASDPNLDKLAFSRGRFIVTLAGEPRLVIPAWPEVARVVEDCRG